MAIYLLKRVLLIIPTLFGIMLFSFIIIQFAPGGPVEQMIAQLMGHSSSIVSRMGGGGGDALGGGGATLNWVRARPIRLPRNIAAPRASIRPSSRASKNSSASTSRRPSAST